MPKCRECKKDIGSNSLYIMHGKVKWFYCSESCRDKKEGTFAERELQEQSKRIEKENKNSFYKLVNEIFGYEVVNQVLFTSFASLHKAYSYKSMLSYVEANKQMLSELLLKDFSSEYGKIRYFYVVVSNNMKDFVDEVESAKKDEIQISLSEEYYEPKYKQRKKRRSLYDVEMEVCK